jgi:hypothetical protein
VPRVTCGIGQQTERAQTLNDRTLQFIIGEVVELAGRANLATPDPLPTPISLIAATAALN